MDEMGINLGFNVGIIKYLIDDRFAYKRGFTEGVVVDKLGANSYMVSEPFDYVEGITFEEVEYRLGVINRDIETWVLYDSDGYPVEFEMDEVID
jgi:hypothetical protein